MRSLRTWLAGGLAAAVLAPAALAQTVEAPGARYTLDPGHSFLSFNVSHNGLSTYQVWFTDWDAELDFDPAAPAGSGLTVAINPTGLDTVHPDPEKKGEWLSELGTADRWLNGDEFPQITFTATSAKRTGDDTGRVTGDLAFLGQTKPVTLDVTFNGAGTVPWLPGKTVLGFDAETTLKRSDWGMDALLPNIGDDVRIAFTGEFIQAD